MAKNARVSTVEARAMRFGSTRQGKYNAKGERVDGHWFASQAEAERYRQLTRLVDQDRIVRLELQPLYRLVVNGQHIGDYRGDFRYQVIDPDTHKTLYLVVEDVKGMVTDVYMLKKKLVEALYEIDVNEIPAGKVGHWEGRTP